MIQQPLKRKIFHLQTQLSEKEKQIELLTFGLLQEKNKIKELESIIENLKDICSKYIPSSSLDEANNELIHLCKGDLENMGKAIIK
ncbi:MAG: hypothetical protein PHF37_03195 [Phycisphaerae bacterium]|nr:hypothetical protein [Phycisphaerae bacterium]